MAALFVKYDIATGKVLSVEQPDALTFTFDPSPGVLPILTSGDFDGALMGIPWADTAVINGMIVDTRPDQALARAKATAFAAIDAKTNDIVARGFTYQGKTFSTSLNAQARFLAMDQLRDDPLMQYPITWNTLDDSDAIQLPDAETLHAFVLTGVGYYRAAVDAGSALKAQVRAATTLEGVQAVVDARA